MVTNSYVHSWMDAVKCQMINCIFPFTPTTTMDLEVKFETSDGLNNKESLNAFHLKRQTTENII